MRLKTLFQMDRSMVNSLDGCPGDRFRLLLEMEGAGYRFVDVEAVEQAFLAVHEGRDAELSIAR